jgi:hypothetical protein
MRLFEFCSLYRLQAEFALPEHVFSARIPAEAGTTSAISPKSNSRPHAKPVQGARAAWYHGPDWLQCD